MRNSWRFLRRMGGIYNCYCFPLCQTLCSTPGFPVHHHLLELAQTHVHLVSDAIQWCHPLLLPSVFPSIMIFSNDSAKYWSFSCSISPSNEYSGLIFFRIDWFDFLAVQGILKSLLHIYILKISEVGPVQVVGIAQI